MIEDIIQEMDDTKAPKCCDQKCARNGVAKNTQRWEEWEEEFFCLVSKFFNFYSATGRFIQLIIIGGKLQEVNQ